MLPKLCHPMCWAKSSHPSRCRPLKSITLSARQPDILKGKSGLQGTATQSAGHSHSMAGQASPEQDAARFLWRLQPHMPQTKAMPVQVIPKQLGQILRPNLCKQWHVPLQGRLLGHSLLRDITCIKSRETRWSGKLCL